MPALKQHEFRPIAVEIEEAPLPIWEWATLSTIVLAVSATVGFLTLGQVDVVVSAQGKVIPRGQILVIQPLETGVVRKLNVKPGDFVRKGQTLMEIQPELVEPEIASAKKELDTLSVQRERIMALVQGRAFSPSSSGSGEVSPTQLALEANLYQTERDALTQELKTKDSEKAQVEKQISVTERSLQEAKEMLALAKQKWEKISAVESLLSSYEIDPVKSDMVKFESERDRAEAQLAELNHKLLALDSQKAEIKKDFSRRLLKEIDQTKQQEIELSARLRQHGFRIAMQNIVAPADGTINERFVNTEGGVVTPAEKLMTLVPKDQPLEIEALATNRDVGYIRPDLKASLKIDTFDYQRYGLIDATVTKVASDSIKDEKLGEVFKVYLRPEKLTLKVDGKVTPITSGMTVVSEIKVGKRRMIEFFLNPIIKSWQHSVSLK
ncbi:MAG: HlyD family secretion protein [Candidatus Obscuribacterales bacterium]|nr:HlyD family secretion protein [Candidatus Obscuribacterales bacterium]